MQRKIVLTLFFIIALFLLQFGQELNKGEIITSFTIAKDNGAQCYCDTNYGKLVETGKIKFNETTKKYEQDRYEVVYETNIINILQHLGLSNWKVFKDHTNQKGVKYSEYFAKAPVNYIVNKSINQSINFETNGLEPHVVVTCTMTKDEYNSWYKNHYNTYLFIGEDKFDQLNVSEYNEHKPFYVKNAEGATVNVKITRVFDIPYFKDPEFINKITFGKQILIGFETHTGYKKVPLSSTHIQTLKELNKIYQLYASRVQIKGIGNLNSYRPVIVSEYMRDSVLFYTNDIEALDKKCKEKFQIKVDFIKAQIRNKYDSLENEYTKSGIKEKLLLLSERLDKLREGYSAEYRNLTASDKTTLCKKYGIAENKLNISTYERLRKNSDNIYMQTQNEYNAIIELRKKYPNTTPYIHVLALIDELTSSKKLNIKELNSWDTIKISELYDKLRILKR